MAARPPRRRRRICTDLGEKIKRAKHEGLAHREWEEKGGYCLWGYLESGVIFQRFLDQRCLDAFRGVCRRSRRNVVAATIYSCRQLLTELKLYRPQPAAADTLPDSGNNSAETVVEVSDEEMCIRIRSPATWTAAAAAAATAPRSEMLQSEAGNVEPWALSQ